MNLSMRDIFPALIITASLRIKKRNTTKRYTFNGSRSKAIIKPTSSSAFHTAGGGMSHNLLSDSRRRYISCTTFPFHSNVAVSLATVTVRVSLFAKSKYKSYFKFFTLTDSLTIFIIAAMQWMQLLN